MERPGREEIEDPPATFIEELEALGGHGKRAGSLEEARDYVLDLAREREAELLVRWDVEYLEELGADEPLREAGVEVALWRDIAGPQRDSRTHRHRALDRTWAIAETGIAGSGARSGARPKRNAPAADIHGDTSGR